MVTSSGASSGLPASPLDSKTLPLVPKVRASQLWSTPVMPSAAGAKGWPSQRVVLAVMAST